MQRAAADTPLIINLAPTGMVPRKQHTEHVPVSVGEVLSDLAECVPLGIGIAHLHARDADGEPTTDPAAWAALMAAVRDAHPQLVVVGTTSGRDRPEFEQRAAVLELDADIRPDMGSLTLGSMNFMHQASMNSPDMIRRLAGRMAEQGVKPELEVFDLGMVNFAHQLIREDLLQPPYYFNILLGNIATAQARLLPLAAIMAELPEESVVGIAGLGQFQRVATRLGVAVTDAVRVGIEDNIWYDRETNELATNAKLVSLAAGQAEAAERGVATPDEVRERLGLPRGIPARPSRPAAAGS